MSTGTLGASPCGIDLPGIGEVLVDFAPGKLFALYPGLFPYVPTGQVPVLGSTLQDDPTLLGLTFYAQGLWIDSAGGAPSEPLRLTNALQLSIGL